MTKSNALSHNSPLDLCLSYGDRADEGGAGFFTFPSPLSSTSSQFDEEPATVAPEAIFPMAPAQHFSANYPTQRASPPISLWLGGKASSERTYSRSDRSPSPYIVSPRHAPVVSEATEFDAVYASSVISEILETLADSAVQEIYKDELFKSLKKNAQEIVTAQARKKTTHQMQSDLGVYLKALCKLLIQLEKYNVINIEDIEDNKNYEKIKWLHPKTIHNLVGSLEQEGILTENEAVELKIDLGFVLSNDHQMVFEKAKKELQSEFSKLKKHTIESYLLIVSKFLCDLQKEEMPYKNLMQMSQTKRTEFVFNLEEKIEKSKNEKANRNEKEKANEKYNFATAIRKTLVPDLILRSRSNNAIELTGNNEIYLNEAKGKTKHSRDMSNIYKFFKEIKDNENYNFGEMLEDERKSKSCDASSNYLLSRCLCDLYPIHIEKSRKSANYIRSALNKAFDIKLKTPAQLDRVLDKQPSRLP